MSDIKQPTRNSIDLLLSIEEKILLLTKMLVTNDMNNKLILDRLNKLLNDKVNSNTIIDSKVEVKNNAESGIIKVNKSLKDIKKEKSSDTVKREDKIPVGQRVVDVGGKDIFNANVSIFDNSSNFNLEIKTNAIGKWQAYLPVGKFVIKITSTSSDKKIESIQNIEVEDSMKSLQLPINTIK